MFERVKEWFTPKSRSKEPRYGELQENAEKALRMKQEAGPQTKIPEHRTAHQGGVSGGQTDYTDAAHKQEGAGTANLSRAHGARVGDSGKSTGPGR